jgi:undecaprenyl-diphosphatase
MTKQKLGFWKGTALVSAEVITNMVTFAGLFSGFVYLIRPGMRKHKKTDLRIFELIKAHTNERNTKLMSFFTYFGTHNFFIPANLFLIFYFLLIRKRSWLSIRVASIAISSLGLMFLLKYLFKRKRPLYPLEAAKGLSFPSGHAIMSVTFYGLLIYVVSQTIKDKPLKWTLMVSLAAFVQLIGFSRVYLRVHYASDVAVGYITGLMWLLISLKVLKRMENYTLNYGNKIAMKINAD